jgi:hypothetical protein
VTGRVDIDSVDGNGREGMGGYSLYILTSVDLVYTFMYPFIAPSVMTIVHEDGRPERCEWSRHKRHFVT